MKERMSLQDASQVLGVTVDALRKRLKRGTLKGRKDKSGKWLIDVDTDTGKDTVHESASNELVKSLQSEIEFLRAELQRKDTLLMSMTSRIPKLEAPKRKKINIWPFRKSQDDDV